MLPLLTLSSDASHNCSEHLFLVKQKYHFMVIIVTIKQTMCNGLGVVLAQKMQTIKPNISLEWYSEVLHLQITKA